MAKRTVAVIGATGTVGQRFIQLLEDHPWFTLTELAASAKSAGKDYRDATHWSLDTPMPEEAAGIEIKEAGSALDADVVFSALPGGLAKEVERELADRGSKVFSNASDHRRVQGVPLVITEVNADHFRMLDDRDTDGFIVTNGNCSGIVATLALAPLYRTHGIEGVHVVTLQALSGAGYPGVPSMDVLDNLVPYIPGEEDKVESEPQYVLGALGDKGAIQPVDFPISSTCTRVPVLEGHAMAMHIKLKDDADADTVRATLQEGRGLERLDLPSAPAHPVLVHDDPARPQPRRDRGADNGMSVTVGRIRADPLGSIKFFACGSNTIRGAAGQSILNAEYLVQSGKI